MFTANEWARRALAGHHQFWFDALICVIVSFAPALFVTCRCYPFRNSPCLMQLAIINVAPLHPVYRDFSHVLVAPPRCDIKSITQITKSACINKCISCSLFLSFFLFFLLPTFLLRAF